MVTDNLFIVSTWTKPDDDRSLRTGLWRLDARGAPSVEQVNPALDAIYWATSEPEGASLLMLHNDDERSSMLRLSESPSHGLDVSGPWSAGGEGGSFLAFHPAGTHFVVSNSRTGWAVFRNSHQPELVASYQHSGSGPHPRQARSHPHSALFSEDGRGLYAVDMGTDEVLAIPFDAQTESLGSAMIAYRAEPGSGPRHILAGRGVYYLLNELGSSLEVLQPQSDGSFVGIQKASTLPPDFEGDSHGAHLGLSPDGKTVYASNRQHDSIAVFGVRDDGSLHVRGWVPTDGGWPWHFVFADDSRMLVANNQSDEVAFFDVVDGWPTRVGAVSIPRPVFIAPHP